MLSGGRLEVEIEELGLDQSVSGREYVDDVRTRQLRSSRSRTSEAER